MIKILCALAEFLLFISPLWIMIILAFTIECKDNEKWDIYYCSHNIKRKREKDD